MKEELHFRQMHRRSRQTTRGGKKSNPPGAFAGGQCVVEPENDPWQNLATGERAPTETKTWARSHQAFQPLAPKPAQTELIYQNDATSAEEGFQYGGNSVSDRKSPTAIRALKACEKANQVEGTGQPERDVHEHANFGPKHGPGIYGTMQQNVSLLLIKENFAGGGGNEHSQKGEGHGMEIDGQRKYRLPHHGEGHAAKQEVKKG